jgi:hypothetical protein
MKCVRSCPEPRIFVVARFMKFRNFIPMPERPAYAIAISGWNVSKWPDADAHEQSAVGSAFIAPPGRTVYFGDYVFVGNRTVEFRSDIDAARLGIRALLSRGVVLEQAEPTTTAHVHGFLCTP